MSLGCGYMRLHERTYFESSDYVPASFWGKIDEEEYYTCNLTGDYCDSENEPDTCPVQMKTGFLCPCCLEDDLGNVPMLKNQLGILFCENGHNMDEQTYRDFTMELADEKENS